MNKRELAKAVAVQSDVDLRTVTSVLDGLTDVVTAVVAKGEPVAISGFAKFVKVERAARMGRNPATGEQIHIKASKRARITPVKAFKEAVMSPSGAPRLARGAYPTNPDAVKNAGKAVGATPAKAAPATKAASRKTAARKATTKRAPARKASTTRVAGRKAVARKATTRKAVARKATTKRAPARKASTSRSSARRPAAKKATRR